MSMSVLFRVYGYDGHRQKASFGTSGIYDWSDENGTRIIEMRCADVTGTNAYAEIRITRDSLQDVLNTLEGQLSDGAFENMRYGEVFAIIDNEEHEIIYNDNGWPCGISESHCSKVNIKPEEDRKSSEAKIKPSKEESNMEKTYAYILWNGEGVVKAPGDTIWGDNNNPAEVKRWPESEKTAAYEELAKHKCRYWVEKAWPRGFLKTADEYALELCEVDEEDGEYICGGFFDLAPEDAAHPFEKKEDE